MTVQVAGVLDGFISRSQHSNPQALEPSGRYQAVAGLVTPIEEWPSAPCAPGPRQNMVLSQAIDLPSRHSTLVEKSVLSRLSWSTGLMVVRLSGAIVMSGLCTGPPFVRYVTRTVTCWLLGLMMAMSVLKPHAVEPSARYQVEPPDPAAFTANAPFKVALLWSVFSMVRSHAPVAASPDIGSWQVILVGDVTLTSVAKISAWPLLSRRTDAPGRKPVPARSVTLTFVTRVPESGVMEVMVGAG